MMHSPSQGPTTAWQILYLDSELMVRRRLSERTSGELLCEEADAIGPLGALRRLKCSARTWTSNRSRSAPLELNITRTFSNVIDRATKERMAILAGPGSFLPRICRQGAIGSGVQEMRGGCGGQKRRAARGVRLVGGLQHYRKAAGSLAAQKCSRRPS